MLPQPRLPTAGDRWACRANGRPAVARARSSRSCGSQGQFSMHSHGSQRQSLALSSLQLHQLHAPSSHKPLRVHCHCRHLATAPADRSLSAPSRAVGVERAHLEAERSVAVGKLRWLQAAGVQEQGQGSVPRLSTQRFAAAASSLETRELPHELGGGSAVR